jgi:hypothetical protein
VKYRAFQNIPVVYRIFVPGIFFAYRYTQVLQITVSKPGYELLTVTRDTTMHTHTVYNQLPMVRVRQIMARGNVHTHASPIHRQAQTLTNSATGPLQTSASITAQRQPRTGRGPRGAPGNELIAFVRRVQGASVDTAGPNE